MKTSQKKYSNKQLKQIFLAYVEGAFSQNSALTNKQVIINFCDKYKLCFDDVSYAKYRKTYYRHCKNLELP